MHPSSGEQTPLPNGPAAAAILAAGAGACAMGVFYILGNASSAANRVLSIYKPAGALSGVSSGAIVTWLLVWIAFAARWRHTDVRLNRVTLYAGLLLATGLLLTFPPVARLF